MITFFIWFNVGVLVAVIATMICMRGQVKFLMSHEWVGIISIPIMIYTLITISNPWGWFWGIMILNFLVNFIVLVMILMGKITDNIFVPWYWRHK